MENMVVDDSIDTLAVMEIRNAGDINSECIVVWVMRDCNLKGYLLGVMPRLHRWEYPNRIDTAIWLPDLNVKEGDELLIWTKAGADFDIDDIETHQLFLENTESLWAQGTSPVLFEIRRYAATIAGDDGFPAAVFAGGFTSAEGRNFDSMAAEGHREGALNEAA